MEISYIEFEKQLVIIKNNQKITITPFLTNEYGNIKFGIDAPKGVVVDREEIYILKKENNTPEKHHEEPQESYSKKVQSLFTLFLTIPFKSEKLEKAAKKLFNRDKILTPKSLHKIAQGEIETTGWIVTCVIDILIQEEPISLKNILSTNALYRMWAKPLLSAGSNKITLINKAKQLYVHALVEKITSLSNQKNQSPTG